MLFIQTCISVHPAKLRSCPEAAGRVERGSSMIQFFSSAGGK
jgi:hypothetical protein